MKTILISISILAASFCCCTAQTLGVRLAAPKTIVIVPAVTMTTDSITVNEFIDNGTSLSALITLYSPTSNPISTNSTMRLTIWDGVDYVSNKNYTKTQLKARIKTLLSQ